MGKENQIQRITLKGTEVFKSWPGHVSDCNFIFLGSIMWKKSVSSSQSTKKNYKHIKWFLQTLFISKSFLKSIQTIN